jgi:hypothetical protein
MKKHLNTIFSLIFLTALLTLPYFVFAQASTASDTSLKGKLQSVGQMGGYKVDGSVNLLSMIGLIINSVLGLLGAIFIILMIVAGFGWMTAAGNEQKTEKAIATIKHSIIGLIITLSSWAIWSFIFTAFINK